MSIFEILLLPLHVTIFSSSCCQDETHALIFADVSAGVVCSPSVTKVTADRPFYFQIVDEKMDVVLLAGTVRNPSATVPAPYNVESTTEGMPAGNN